MAVVGVVVLTVEASLNKEHPANRTNHNMRNLKLRKSDATYYYV